MVWPDITTDGELIGGQLWWKDPSISGDTEYAGVIVTMRVPPRSNKVQFVLGWIAKRPAPDVPWEVELDVPHPRHYRPVDCDEPVYSRGVWTFHRGDEEVRLYCREVAGLVRPRQVSGLSQCLLIVACPDAAHANTLAATMAGRPVTVYDRLSGAMSTHE